MKPKEKQEQDLSKEDSNVLKIVGTVILLSALVFINIKVANKLMNK